jgi:hypothetical protein
VCSERLGRALEVAASTRRRRDCRLAAIASAAVGEQPALLQPVPVRFELGEPAEPRARQPPAIASPPPHRQRRDHELGEQLHRQGSGPGPWRQRHRRRDRRACSS